MDRPSLSDLLAALATDPDNDGIGETIVALVRESPASDAFLRELEMARARHEERTEFRAFAMLIAAEVELAKDDPSFHAALLRELGRVRHEELLDDAGAIDAYAASVALEAKEETEAQLEHLQHLQAKWKQISERFEEEAERASEGNLRASLLSRAASLVWQYRKRGRDAAADELFKRALEADPGATQIARLHAETLRQRGEWEPYARVMLVAAREARAREEKLNCLVCAARVFAKQLKKPKSAATCYEQVIELMPAHEEALRFMVAYATEHEEWDRLVALYERALRAPQSIESEEGTLLQLAMVHWRIRKSAEDAEPYFARLRAIDPAHPSMISFYEEEYAESAEEGDKYLVVLADALRVTSDAQRQVAIASELAERTASRHGSGDRVVELWKSVLRIEPQNNAARAALRQIYVETGKWNALIDLLRQDVEFLPLEDREGRARVLREMVPIFRDRLGLDAMVIQTYRSIRELLPNDAEAADALSRVYEETGRYADLVRLLEERGDASADKVTQIELYTRVTTLWIERFSNTAAATGALEKILALDPNSRFALDHLKQIYERSRDYQRLYDVLARESALASDPTVRLENRKALARIASERLHKPREAMEHLRAVFDETGDVEALESLEKLAIAERAWDVLAFALEQQNAKEKDPRARTTRLRRLGALYRDELGDSKKAATVFESLLHDDPTNTRALRVLREVHLEAENWDDLERVFRAASDWEGLVDAFGTAADRATDPAVRIDLSLRAAKVYENELKQPARAFRSYERVLAADPRHVGAASALVPIYQHDENWARLAAVKRVLLDVTPKEAVKDRVDLILELADLSLTRLGDAPAAATYAEQAVRAMPTDDHVLDATELLAIQGDRLPAHVDILRSCAESLSGDDAIALRRRTASLLVFGLSMVPAAIVELEEASRIAPKDEGLEAELEALYLRESDFGKLASLHRVRAARQSGDARRTELLRLAALEEDQLDDLAAAAKTYEDIASDAPKDVETLRSLARIYRLLSSWDALSRTLGRLEPLLDDTDRAEAMRERAEVLLDRMAEPAAALDVYEALEGGAPSHERAIAGIERIEKMDATLAVRAGRLLERAYEARDAHSSLREVLERRLAASKAPAEQREVRDRLIALYDEKLGNKAAAFALSETAFLEEPGSASVRERFEALGRATETLPRVTDVLLQVAGQGGTSPSDRAELLGHAARIAHTELRDPARAEPIYLRILADNPADKDAFDALRAHYTDAAKWRDLEGLYRARIAVEKDTSVRQELLLEAAFVYEEVLEDVARAIDAFEEVYMADPLHLAARKALDRLYRRAQRWRDLAGLLKTERDGATGDEFARISLELGDIHRRRLGAPSAALAYFEEALSADPGLRKAQEAVALALDDEELKVRAAEVLSPLYENDGNWTELVRVMRVRLDAMTDTAAEFALRARVADVLENKLRDLPSAFAMVARMVEIDPLHRDARATLARLAETRNAEPERAQVLESVISRVNDVAERRALLTELAELWSERVGDSARAESAYERLLAVAGDDSALIRQSARALEEIRQRSEGGRSDPHGRMKLIELQITHAEDDDARVQLLLRGADILVNEASDGAGALMLHERALVLAPDNVTSLAAVATLAEAAGNHARAIAAHQALADALTSPDDQRLAGLRAADLIATHGGDSARSIAAYRSFIERFGADRETVVKLATLEETAGDWAGLLRTLAVLVDETADVLERAEVRFRMGEVLRAKLNDSSEAYAAYVEVLSAAPDHAGAMAGLLALLADKDVRVRVDAARSLLGMGERAVSGPALLRVLDVLAESDVDAEAFAALTRGAEVAERDLHDPAAAYGRLDRAVRRAESADAVPLLDEAARLAEVSGAWSQYLPLIQEVEGRVTDAAVLRGLWIRAADVQKLHLGKGVDAAVYYERALDEQPDDVVVMDALIDVYGAASDHESLARVLARKVERTESAKERAELLRRLAELREGPLEDPAGAIEIFEQLFDAGEGKFALAGLRRLYTSLEQWGDLASLIERMLDAGEIEPVEAHYELGVLARDKFVDLDRAMDHFRAAFGLRADHVKTAEALQGLMAVDAYRVQAAELLEPYYLHKLDWKQVTTVLDARIGAEANDLSRKRLRLRRAQIIEEYIEDLDAAFTAYADLLREDRSDATVVDTLARLARVLDRHGDLARVYQSVLDDVTVDDPSSAELARMTGRLFAEHTDDMEAAAACFERVLRFDARDDWAAQSLEAVLLRLNAHARLVDFYRERADQQDSDVDAVAILQRRVQILAGPLGDVNGAIDAYVEILDLQPADPVALDELERMLRATSRWDDLVEHLGRRAELAVGTPVEFDRRFDVGVVQYEKLSRLTDALDTFGRILAGLPTHRPTVAYLEDLVRVEEHRLEVAAVLEPVYRTTNQWKKLVAVLEAEVLLIDDPIERGPKLAEIAELHEVRGKNPSLALSAWARVFGDQPDMDEVRVEVERLAAQTEDWDALVRAYEQALAASNSASLTTDLLRALAETHDARRGDPRSAIEAYERLAAHDEMDVVPLKALEQLHMLVGDWPSVDEVLGRQVTRLAGNDERGAVHRARAELRLDQLNDRPGAIAAYLEALEENAEDADALSSLDRLYEETADYGKLSDVLRRRFDMATPEERLPLGVRRAQVLAERLNDPNEAISTLESVLADHPADLGALELAGSIFERTNRDDDWVANLEAQAAAQPMPMAKVSLLVRAGEILERRLDDADGAFSRYADAIALEPTYGPAVDALLRLTQVAELRGRAAEVLLPVLEAARRHADLVAVLLRTADDAFDAQGKHDAYVRAAGLQERELSDAANAFVSLERAVAAYPNQMSTLDELFRVASAMNGWARAVSVAEEAAQATADGSTLLAIFERIAKVSEEQLHDDRRAMAAINGALLSEGESPSLLAWLDRLLAKGGDTADLAAVIERRVVVAADDAERVALLLRLGTLFRSLGDLPNGVAAYERVVGIAPTDASAATALGEMLTEPSVALSVADILEPVYRAASQHGRVAQLYEVRERMGDDDSDRARHLVTAADLWERAGEGVKAVQSLRRAVALVPTDDVAWGELDRVAQTHGAFGELRGLAEEVTESGRLDASLVAEINLRAARWYADRLGDPAAAEARIRVALASDPESDDAHAAAVALYRNGGRAMDTVRALGAWAQVTRDPLLKAERQLEAATLAESAGGAEPAVRALYEEVVATKPDDLTALDALIRLHAAHDRPRDTASVIAARIEVTDDVGDRVKLRHDLGALYAGTLGDTAAAIETYRALREDAPMDPGADAALERLFAETKDSRALADLFEERADRAETVAARVAALLRLGTLYATDMRRPDDAVRVFRDVIAMDAPNADAWSGLVSAYESSKNYDGMIEALEDRASLAADRGDTNDEVEWLSRAAAARAEHLGDGSEEQIYARILERAPNHVAAVRALASLHGKREAWEPMAEALSRLVDMEPGPAAAEAALSLADVLEGKLGDATGAKAALGRAFAADPTNAAAHTRWYAALEASGDVLGQVDVLLTSASRMTVPTEAVATLTRAATLLTERVGDHTRAASVLEQASQRAPEDRAVLTSLADAYAASGRTAEALATYERIVATYGGKRVKELALVYHRMGHALETGGDAEGALRAYDNAFKYDLSSIPVLRDLGRLTHARGDFERSQKALRALLLQRLDDRAGISKADIYFLLGDMAQKQGDTAKAVSMLERALAESRGHAQAQALLSTLKPGR